MQRLAHRVRIVTCICLGLLGLGASAAHAATVYRTDGTAFASPGAEEGSNPDAVAVEQSSGRVLMATKTVVPARVSVFVPEGGSAKYVASFGEAELLVPRGVAIDQTSGSVYVIDEGLGEIVKYEKTGPEPTDYARDTTFTSPPQGFELGQIGSFWSPIEVDPTSGDLLVADRGAQRVSRFEADGTFVASFDGSGAPEGAFHAISSLTVDGSGDIYVVDAVEGDIVYGGRSVVERFSPDGTADTSFLPPIPTPRTVGYDRAADNLLVTGRSDGPTNVEHFPIRLYVLHADQVIDEVDFPAVLEGSFSSGLAVDEATPHRLYAATQFSLFGGRGEITVFEAFPAADVTLAAPTGVSARSVDLAGSVNPRGEATSYHFEYSREGGPPLSSEAVEVGSGESPVPVEATLDGLVANSQYTVKLVASTAGIAISSRSYSFQTPASAPEAITLAATDLEGSSATLRGKVNPFGLQTTYRFEYGPTTSYGASAPASAPEVAGNGRELIGVAVGIDGLEAGREYHYRLVAESAEGVGLGGDRSFTIPATAPVRRYEMVSPVEKGRVNVDAGSGFSVSPDGERLVYRFKSAPGGEVTSEAAPLLPTVIARRGIDSWHTRALDPPQTPEAPVTRTAFVLGVSEDGRKALVISRKSLAPGAIEGGSNFYVRDTATGEYTTVAAEPERWQYDSTTGFGFSAFFGASADFSHLLIQSSPLAPPLVPETASGALFDWTGGELKPVSIDSGGNSVSVNNEIYNQRHEPTFVSDDGSRLVFPTYSGTTIRTPSETIYLGGIYVGADSEVEDVFLVGQDLEPDSPPGQYLYRYRVGSGDLEPLVGPFPGSESIMQVSDSGSSVFFFSSQAFSPDAVEGVSNLYAWHEGEVSWIGAIPRELNKPQEFLASPNGRYLVFSSFSTLTGYDNTTTRCAKNSVTEGANPEACREVYRYDVETKELVCASCRPDGPPTGSAHIRPAEGKIEFGIRHWPRSILDSGQVFFDTPDPLSPRDANSVSDVYEYDEGRQTLISAGTGSRPSIFADASPDGRDVFFTTPDRLVGQDRDDLVDVYDARIGGGLSAQNPPEVTDPCAQEECRLPIAPPPGLSLGGSETVEGPSNAKPRRHCGRPAAGKRAKKAKKGCAKHRKSRHQKRRTRR